MIRHHMDADGGFTAGDTVTGRTHYAYPTSNAAQSARHSPEYVAQAMLLEENRMGTDRDTSKIGRDYDALNWATLNAIKVPA